jgi:hypothetical protein
MEPSSFIVGGVACFAAFVALIVIFAVVTSRRERDRQDALRLWAASCGWQATRRPAVDWGRRMPGRNSRGVTLALSGTIAGRTVTIGEYHHTRTTSSTSSTDMSSSSTTTYHYVLMVVRLRRPGPTIAVFRRGAMSRFGRSLFGDRATAIGYEPFDSAYRVAADDATSVPSVLGQALVAEHVAGRLPDWSLQGDELLTFREGRIGEPASIPGQFAPLLRVADLLETTAHR